MKKRLTKMNQATRTFKKLIKPMSTNVKMYLTAEELVERFRGIVTKNTLANWRSHGEGPTPTKIGGQVLYKTSEVEAWEQDRTTKR